MESSGTQALVNLVTAFIHSETPLFNKLPGYLKLIAVRISLDVIVGVLL
jgi:hypothetical protein